MSCYSCRMTPCVCGASADSPSYWKDKEKEKEDYAALQRRCEEAEKQRDCAQADATANWSTALDLREQRDALAAEVKEVTFQRDTWKDAVHICAFPGKEVHTAIKWMVAYYDEQMLRWRVALLAGREKK